MLIIFIPILIPFLLVLSVYFLIRRSLIVGAIFFIITILLNYYTQTIPFHPSYFFTSSEKKENQIRILSYNIKYNSDYLQNNKDSLSALISFIQQQDADILVLPESRINSTNKNLRKKLDQIYPYHIGSEYEGNEFYLETYVFSRYPINHVKQYEKHYIYEMDIELSDNPKKGHQKKYSCLFASYRLDHHQIEDLFSRSLLSHLLQDHRISHQGMSLECYHS